MGRAAFPAFPLQRDIWSDGDNWLAGHWLNGRLGSVAIGDLINAILAEHGLPAADVEKADGTAPGYVIADPTTARAAIEPLAELFGLAIREEAGALRIATAGAQAAGALEIEDLVAEGGTPAAELVRIAGHDLPAEAQLLFRDPLADYQQAAVREVFGGGEGGGQEAIGFAGMLETGEAEALLSDWLRRRWQGRERIAFAVPAAERRLVPGSIFRLPAISGQAEYIVEEVEEGLARRISAKRIARLAPFPQRVRLPVSADTPFAVAGKPLALYLDLPMTPGAARPEEQLRVAAWAKPWRAQACFASPEETGFAQRATIAQPATIGELAAPVGSGRAGRVDGSAALLVRLFGGALSSISRLRMLNGANAAAIRSASGQWELMQFQTAEEVEPDLWRLTNLLRGQLGSEDAMAAGAAQGADFVLLDEAARPAGLSGAETGMPLNWRTGPAGYDFTDAYFDEQTVTGGVRALTPLSPVHLRAATTVAGDVVLSWIRRGRINADNWLGTDIPLGEEAEFYSVEIRSTAGAVVRTVQTGTSAWTYLAAQMAADFPDPGSEADLVVRQISAAVGPGLPATTRIVIS